MRRTQIVPKVGFHIRRIVLKNVIYLYVQNIYTYPLFEFNLAIQNVFFVQSDFTYNPRSTIFLEHVLLNQWG